MNKFIMLSMMAFVLFFSCKKTEKATPTDGRNAMYIPWDMDSLMPVTASERRNGASRLSVDGIFVACKLSGNLTDISGNTLSYIRNWQAVMPMHSYIDSAQMVDSVSLNGIRLKKRAQHFFLHYDTVGMWRENDANHWYMSGSDSIPFISEDIPGLMPTFTGVLPVNISRSGFSFRFDASNTQDADSAYFVLVTKESSNIVESGVVNTKGGTAAINAATLRSFRNTFFQLGLLSSGPTYSGGYIVFVIYNHEIRTIGGKKYAFVKQREYIGIVNFL